MHLSFRKLREALAVFFVLGIPDKEGKCFALFFFFTISKTILGCSKAGRTLESEGNRHNKVLP